MVREGDTLERFDVPDTVEELMAMWDLEPYAYIDSNEPYKVGEDDGTLAERKLVKAAFIAGELENPVVSYPNLRTKELEGALVRIDAMLENAERLDDGIDKDLARQLMRRKHIEVRRHLEIAAAWDSDTDDDWQEHLDSAAELQQEIFGSPDQDHFDHMVHGLRAKATELSESSHDDTVKGIADELLALTGDRPEPTDFPAIGLSDEAREVLKGDIESRRLIEDEVLKVNRAEDVPHDRARTLFRLIQEAHGAQEAGWDTRIVDGTAAESSRRTRSINIGRERKAYTADSLRLNEVHEGGHSRRAYNGEKLAESQNKPMARYALPDSLDFEEGFMVAMEQIVSGSKRIPGEQYYTAAGLMLGMDNEDGEKRDFRKTYEIMWRRGVVEAAAKGEALNVDKCKSDAYQLMMRMTRGGALDTRDLSYYRGYVKATAWLSKVAERSDLDRRKAWMYVMSASFDPTNSLHAAYIQRGQDQRTVYNER